MPTIPTSEVISGYEKLGIVGILLLVLFIGLLVIVWAVKQAQSTAAKFFEFVTHLTKALAQQAAAFERQHESQISLHERLDNLMSCTRSGCPVFEMRKKQHKDATRFENPPHDTATASH